VECVFCSIVAGGAAVRVYSDGVAVGFLDARPVFPGHVLVVPRAHVVDLADLPAPLVGDFFAAVQVVAAAVESGMAAGGTFVAINNKVSQSVPHLHVHVVPRTKGDGLRGFFWPRQRYASDLEMEEVGARIRARVGSGRAT
jgi:histidine triad (HIT) family protein